MDKYFNTRHTVRHFSKKEISNDFLEKLILAACHAPTTGNMQLYSIIITKDPENKKRLAPAHFSQPAFMNAPVILTFCADLNRFVQWCVLRHAIPGYDNIQSFIAAALDTTILAQQFVTIAEKEGLGTCYLGTTTYNADKIQEALNLPSMVVPIISIAVGYPEGEETASDRLPVKAIIHNEAYKQYSEDEINDYYKEKESLSENIKYVIENGKETLAQVFTDVRYPRENNEIFSKVFIQHLKAQGFLE